jgi:hypothetical protein
MLLDRFATARVAAGDMLEWSCSGTSDTICEDEQLGVVRE